MPRKPKLDSDGNKIVPKPRGHNLNGRPKGVKNKSSLLKEALKGQWESVLEKEGMAVFLATVQAAKGDLVKDDKGKPVLDENGWPTYTGGSDTCKKMVMDRIAPVVDAQQGSGKDKFNISINVQGMEAKITDMDESVKDITDIEFEEVK